MEPLIMVVFIVVVVLVFTGIGIFVKNPWK
jgi:hypothetical protein